MVALEIYAQRLSFLFNLELYFCDLLNLMVSKKKTFVAAALLVAVGMGQTADFLGLSASTGAFAAGVLLAGNRYRPQIQADIKPFEGILLGVFFLTAGANLDPMLVIHEWPTLLTGVVAFVVTKIGIVFAQGPSLGLTTAQAARVALTLSGGGEFSFVLFNLATNLGVLPDQLAKLLTASVVISMSLTPILGELGDKAGNWIESNMIEEDMEVLIKYKPEDESQMNSLFDEIDTDVSNSIELEELREPLHKRGLPYSVIAEVFSEFDTNNDGIISREEWKIGLEAGLVADAFRNAKGKFEDVEANLEGDFSPDSIVICGFGRMGKNVYNMLVSAEKMKTDQNDYEFGSNGTNGNASATNNIVAFDLNPSRVTTGILAGLPVIFGDGAKYDLFKAAGVPTPKAVIITYDAESRRLAATSRLRESLPPNTPIYVRAKNSQNAEDVLKAGATEAVQEMTESVLRFGSLLNVCNNMDQLNELRQLYKDNILLLSGQNGKSELKRILNPIPGFSESALEELSGEVGYSRMELSNLYEVFSSFDIEGTGLVPIEELRDLVLQKTVDGPIDGVSLMECMESVDSDGDGDLTFEEFVRVSCLPSF